MKNEEKITVIIPTYNRAHLIKRSIDSVLNQTHKNIELIIMDDASTDNTEEVVKEIKDDRIKYIKLKKNSGACEARNIAIKKAEGKYIAFQDSDDVFRPEKLEKQLANMKKNKADLDFCKIAVSIENSNLIIPNEKQEKEINKNKILDELCRGNFISTQAILVKTDCIKKYLWDSKMPRYQDFDLVLRMAPDIKISYSNEVLVDLYTQKDSISASGEKLRKAIVLILKKNYKLNDEQQTDLINYLLDSNPDNSSKYKTLRDNYLELEKNYNVLNDTYQGLINSKRWKMISKIFKK